MSTKDTKSLNELKRAVLNLQQNNANLYKITSALFQELQEIKHFVNYKHEDSLGDVESSKHKVRQSTMPPQSHPLHPNQRVAMNVLDNIEEFAESIPSRSGRSLKIINN